MLRVRSGTLSATYSNSVLNFDTQGRHKGVSFTGISVVFFCWNQHDGKIFLAKRSQRARDEQGTWAPGAGGLKHGESVEATMERELMEEFSVKSLQTDFLGYFDAFRTTPDGQPTHWIAMCFAVKVDPDKVKIGEPEMFDDSGWFDLDTLPQPQHSQFSLFIDKLGDKLKQVTSVR